MDSEILPWALGFSGVVLVGLSIAVALYIIELCNEPLRKQKREQKTSQKSAERDLKYLKSVNLDGTRIVEFAGIYEKRLKDDFLVMEFNAVLSRYRQRTICKKAQLKQNERKNIFANHLPFEDNVVNIGPKKINYINASWVPGIGTNKMYIITQVPLKTTVKDFWHMVWIYNCYIIVMLGKEIVGDQLILDYMNPSTYHDRKYLSIEIKEIQIFSDFLKRTVILHMEGDHREIIHLQFKTWTHASVTTPNVILELRRQMKIEWLQRQGPVVVHCISGCGRSGTFTAISNLCDLIDDIKESRTDTRISIPYEVIEMREKRMMSVANIQQYYILYEAVIHYIVGGITTIPIKQIEKEMQFLSIKSSVTGLTRFERQFKNTKKKTHKLCITDCAGGNRDENQNKNRHFNVIPRDCDRPYLKNIGYQNTSDYINAVMIDSFNSKGHFLVTQWPMDNTINDLWRLFFEKEIHVAVVLDVFVNSKTYPTFWPNHLNQPVGFGSLTVKLIKEFMIPTAVRCQIFQLMKLDFRLKESEESVLKTKNIKIKSVPIREQPWEIAIFHLINWDSEKGVPDRLESLIDLTSLIEEYNTLRSCLSKAAKPPIVVVSRDGFKRAGVLCVLSICLGTFRHYQEIDVYSAVINVKRNRPQLIPTLEEYLLCYELCLEHLTSSNKENYVKYDDGEDEGCE